jgi:hypothetical protein
MYYSHLDSIPDEELDNIRSVFLWCLETGEAEPALRLAGDFFYWEKRVSEGIELITRVLALPGAQAATRERGNALYSAAALSYFHRDYQSARAFGNDLGRLGEELNDSDLIWLHKMISGSVTVGEGNYQAGYDIFLEARLKTDMENKFDYALCTLSMASSRVLLQDLDGAKQHAEEARQILEEINKRNYLVDSDMILGYIALEQANLAVTRTCFLQAIQTAVLNSVQQRLGVIYAGLGGLNLLQSKLYEAARCFGMAEMFIATTGYYARFFIGDISQRYQEQVKSLLGSETFQMAWEEGRAMPMEQAIEFALKELQ